MTWIIRKSIFLYFRKKENSQKTKRLEKDFLEISKWDISEENVRLKSWQIPKLQAISYEQMEE
jgi:hypothetical protein